MKQGMWMKASGESTVVYPKNGKNFSLDELQKFVGGDIERIAILGGEMWVNEEGKLKNLPINWGATNTVAATRLGTRSGVGLILGDVLVTLRNKGVKK